MGVRHADGVVMVADRATQLDAEVAAGIPAAGEDRTKLFVNGHGVAVGVAGRIAAVTRSGVGVDVLDELRTAVADERTRARAAAAVEEVLDRVADALVADGGAPSVRATPFTQPVATVVLVAGPTGSGPRSRPGLSVVGLRPDGLVEQHTLDRGAVFAPASVQPDLELVLLRDHGSTDQLTGVCVDLVRSAARTHPASVSVDVDYLNVTGAGAGAGRVRHSRWRLEVPRH
jgi:hypothetical protein